MDRVAAHHASADDARARNPQRPSDDGAGRASRGAPSTPGVVRVSQSDFVAPTGAPLRLRGFNYYPRQAPWEKLWSDYPAQQIEDDLLAIARIRGNVVRVFLDVRACAGGTGPPVCQTRLQHLLDASYRSGLYVIATLFDFHTEYADARSHSTDRYLDYWVTPFNEHPALLAWDLKNEPDLDRRAHGAEEVDRFLAALAQRIRTYDSRHLVTIGWQTSETACDLAEQLDFVSYHDYGDPNTLGERAMRVRDRCGQRPVVLQEFGAPSGIDGEMSQLEYFDRAASSLAGAGLAGMLIWTWNDFEATPVAVSGGDSARAAREMRFGMLDVGGGSKPTLSLVIEYFFRPFTRGLR